jgi:hypothetical protein
MRLPLAVLALPVYLAFGCSGVDRNGHISAAEYGPSWPFTVADGTLACTHESRRSARMFVTFDSGNRIEYGLNGSARDFGFPDPSNSIMKPDKTGADLQPFIARGLRLCDESR